MAKKRERWIWPNVAMVNALRSEVQQANALARRWRRDYSKLRQKYTKAQLELAKLTELYADRDSDLTFEYGERVKAEAALEAMRERAETAEAERRTLDCECEMLRALIAGIPHGDLLWCAQWVDNQTEGADERAAAALEWLSTVMKGTNEHE